MPHHGQYEHVKEWLQDHDTYEVDELPPVQNTWYEVFHLQDVRLLWCTLWQKNDETVAKDVEVRWTIDGNVYFAGKSLECDTVERVFRNADPSTGGTAGLSITAAEENAARLTDKRGLDFKVEVRMTGVPGTNQRLLGRGVPETLELT